MNVWTLLIFVLLTNFYNLKKLQTIFNFILRICRKCFEHFVIIILFYRLFKKAYFTTIKYNIIIFNNNNNSSLYYNIVFKSNIHSHAKPWSVTLKVCKN